MQHMYTFILSTHTRTQTTNIEQNCLPLHRIVSKYIYLENIYERIQAQRRRDDDVM